MDPFLAEIRAFPFNFAPRGWALCNGALLPISQNTALFSLLGTTFGGDGKTTFGLPNLAGRIPVHRGTGPGLSTYELGQAGGSETVTLTSAEMPAHTHAVAVAPPSDAATSSKVPAGNTVFGQSQARALSTGYVTAQSPPTLTLAPGAVGLTGGSQPHNNMAPALTFTFCIALSGIFPSRS